MQTHCHHDDVIRRSSKRHAFTTLLLCEFHNADRFFEMQIVLQRGNFSHTIDVDVNTTPSGLINPCSATLIVL
jgi:hypothetical protein